MWFIIVSLFQRIPAFSFLFPVARALTSLLIKNNKINDWKKNPEIGHANF